MAGAGQINWSKSQIQLLNGVVGPDASAPGKAEQAIADAMARAPGQEPCGCGVLISRDYAITCSHVVIDCLYPELVNGYNYQKPETDITNAIVFARFPFQERRQDDDPWKVTAYKVERWTAHEDAYDAYDAMDTGQAALPDHLRAMLGARDTYDLCVLKAVEPVRLPRGWQAAQPYMDAIASRTLFDGQGYTPTNGKPVLSLHGQVFVNPESKAEIELYSEFPELRVVEGCSGTGVYDANTSRLLGMVTKRFGETGGTAIPAARLVEAVGRELWVIGAARKEDPVAVKLLSDFKGEFDRKNASDDFDQARLLAGSKDRLGIIFVVGGTNEDVISDFFLRLRNILGDGKALPDGDISCDLSEDTDPDLVESSFKGLLHTPRPPVSKFEEVSLAPVVFTAHLEFSEYQSPQVQEALRRIARQLARPRCDENEAEAFVLVSVTLPRVEGKNRSEVVRAFQQIGADIQNAKDNRGLWSRLSSFGRNSPRSEGWNAEFVKIGRALQVFTLPEIEDFVRRSDARNQVQDTNERRLRAVRTALINANEINWFGVENAIEEATQIDMRD